MALGREHVYAGEIDTILQAERGVSGGTVVQLSSADVRGLPYGAMVASDDRRFAVRHNRLLLPWTHQGFGPPTTMDRMSGPLRLLTPLSTVAAIRAGFRPQFHPSAEA